MVFFVYFTHDLNLGILFVITDNVTNVVRCVVFIVYRYHFKIIRKTIVSSIFIDFMRTTIDRYRIKDENLQVRDCRVK